MPESLVIVECRVRCSASGCVQNHRTFSRLFKAGSSAWPATGLLLPALSALTSLLLLVSLFTSPLASASTEGAGIESYARQSGVEHQSETILATRWQRAIASDRVESFPLLLKEAAAGVPKEPGATNRPDERGQRDSTMQAAQTLRRLVTLTDKTGRTALMVACKHGDLSLVRELAGFGANLHARTHTGGTPFMFAALGNHQRVAEWLVGEGAAIQAAGSNGWTASMIAAAKGFSSLLEWLISVGADVNRPDVYGFTPLMRAVDDQHANAVAVLLSATSPSVIDAQDESGNTALHHAVAGGRITLVRQLVEHRASVDMTNRAGQTALMLAANNPEIDILLRRRVHVIVRSKGH